jgi:hypothetical protein
VTKVGHSFGWQAKGVGRILRSRSDRFAANSSSELQDVTDWTSVLLCCACDHVDQPAKPGVS